MAAVSSLAARLGCLGEVMVTGADQLPGPSGHTALLRRVPCRVGAFAFPFSDDGATDRIVAWLDQGARRAVLQLTSSKQLDLFVQWAQDALPEGNRHRLVLSVPMPVLSEAGEGDWVAGLCAVVGAVKKVVGSFEVDIQGESAPSAEAVAEALKPVRGKEGADDFLEICIACV